ncbi:MAG: 4Fe-4S binding protein, partial [Lachnospiraceae bacterium]|nr:4Fe-4S binding protein [Lachnospiraceae bacterium]
MYRNRIMKSKRQTIRLIIQAVTFALTNGYIKGWLSGKIYKGKLKIICVPGLNCYSCPGALGSCPVGSLQAVLRSGRYKVSLYVLGFIGLFGIIFGRLICGFACPLGLVQDLLYKIPFPKKY